MLLEEIKSCEMSAVDRLRFETLLADLSAAFVDVPAEKVDQLILDAQRQLCACLRMERSSVWQRSASKPGAIVLTHLFPKPDQPVPEEAVLQDLFPWAGRQLLDGRTVSVTRVSSLPPEAARDRETWEYYGTKSALVIPLSAGGQPMMGLLSFDTLSSETVWSEAIHSRCQLIAQVFANALSRAQSERILRESEERYRTLAVNVPGMVYQFYARPDGQWGMYYVDVRAAQVCGVDPLPIETFFDRFTACIAPEEREPWLASIRKAVLGAEEWEQEVRFIKPTGEEMYVRCISRPRRIASELVFTGVLRDITEQKRAEKAMRENLEELRRLREQLQQENVYLRREVETFQGQMPIVGNSKALRQVIAQAQQVAATDSTVLILGETGTGKELLATYLHRIGRRSGKPFIVTNVAAIPSTLIESELFGREKGAYTGAISKQVGRFELADGGTLFLDEIGEMPLETQVKLLRVLQSGEFERLGGCRTLRVNVHVIAATNRKLPDLIRAGAFRQDLFYRLNVFPITLPPLRDRVEDIPLLVWTFIKEFSDRMGKSIERIRKRDLESLQRYGWPGNVRELRNVVERAMIITSDSELRLDLPMRTEEGEMAESRLLRDVQREHILKVLKSAGGRIRGPRGAAQILGLKPTTLYSLMDRIGIARTSDH